MPLKEYRDLSEQELVQYYQWVKQYIEKGFRVDGLKEELELLLNEFEFRSEEVVKNKRIHLKEIRQYIKTIRS